VADSDKQTCFLGTGRRKSSVARVRLTSGKGKIQINGRTVPEYFTEDRDRNAVMAPFEAVDRVGKYDCIANVQGGGFNGQAGAVLLGIARGLKDAEPNLEKALRDSGLLTRDSRMKERKKYGHKGARKSFQFSKR